MFGIGAAKFLTSKPFVGGMVGLVIVTTLFFGYRHYTGLLNRVEDLVATQTVLETGLDIERQTVQQLISAMDSWETSQNNLLGTIAEMQENAHEARQENRRLQELFAEMDLGEMPIAVADSVVNNVSDRLWNSVGTATDPGRYGGAGNPAGEATPPVPGPGSGASGGMDGD